MTKPAFITHRGLDFYIKWIATAVALIHVYLTAHDIMPYYKYTGIIAAGLWLWLGVLWRQPSVIILNTIMVLLYLQGILGLRWV